MFNDIFKTERKGIYIAEIGLNHNGDFKIASDMINAAADAGADAVKFQSFTPECMNSVYTTSLLKTGVEEEPDNSQTDFFHKFVLSMKHYSELKSLAENLGMVFFSSPFDFKSIEMLEKLGVPLYKIASSEITNHPLIKKIAETGRPAILSTGISTDTEISMAIELFKEYSNAEIVLMHCVSLYPPPPEMVNLSRIPALEKNFKIEVGFSDHTNTIDASILAAGLGARIFEKHFTIDRDYQCPEMDVSIPSEDFSKMIESIENAILMMGTGDISYSNNEAPTANAARRSLFAKRSIPKGKIIGPDDLEALRPGIGIPVYMINDVIGRVSKVDIKKDLLIRKKYLE